MEEGLKFLSAIKTHALCIIRTYYQEVLSTYDEYENQEGYWQSIAENVAESLKEQAFLYVNTDQKVGRLSVT